MKKRVEGAATAHDLEVRVRQLEGELRDCQAAAERLKESENRLTFVLRGANEGWWDWDLLPGEMRFSPRLCEMLGYEPNAFAATEETLGAIAHPDDHESVRRASVAVLEEGANHVELESRRKHKDGHWVPILARGYVTRDAAGRPIHISGTATDLSSRKETEASLRRSEAKLAAAFHTLPYALVISRALDGRILEANEAFMALSGYAGEEAVGSTSTALKIWVDEENRWQLMQDLRSDRPVTAREILLRRKNGQVLTALVSAQRFSVDDEIYILSSIDDITQRKRAEAEQRRLQEQLAQAQKMECVGRLAGGIAHDFNNLLMGIMNYVELCRDHVETSSPVRGWLDEIARDATRSADVTRQLLAFARRQAVAPALLDLNAAVPSTLRMLRRLAGEDIDLVWLPGQGAMVVLIDPSQFDQILVNLVVNARDAIGGVGRLVLETTRAVVGESQAKAADVPPGEYVEMVVTDNGAGMSHETLDHIFEPFFTTKADGEGTGLGLATVYGIVRQNGGFIDVVSTLGQGTTFRISLPRAQGEPSQPTGAEGPASCPGGRETILVVEDERSIRVTLERFLEDLGYTVLSAEAEDEALEAASRHAGSIDLLVTDVVMPKMGGRALAERLQKDRPEIRCLFISGYTADIIAHRGVLDAHTDFLAKPFGRDDLARKVRETLDR